MSLNDDNIDIVEEGYTIGPLQSIQTDNKGHTKIQFLDQKTEVEFFAGSPSFPQARTLSAYEDHLYYKGRYYEHWQVQLESPAPPNITALLALHTNLLPLDLGTQRAISSLFPDAHWTDDHGEYYGRSAPYDFLTNPTPNIAHLVFTARFPPALPPYNPKRSPREIDPSLYRLTYFQAPNVITTRGAWRAPWSLQLNTCIVKDTTCSPNAI